jgi:hypothetical protein
MGGMCRPAILSVLCCLGLPSAAAAGDWPHVVLAHGRLYAKDRQGKLKCFVLNEPERSHGTP